MEPALRAGAGRMARPLSAHPCLDIASRERAILPRDLEREPTPSEVAAALQPALRLFLASDLPLGRCSALVDEAWHFVEEGEIFSARNVLMAALPSRPDIVHGVLRALVRASLPR
jgi:hypothetical protein